MPRDPIGALIQLLLGLPLLGVGLVVAAWLATAALEPDLGFGAMMWVAENSPVPLPIAPERLAHEALQHDSMIGIGVAAFLLCLIGWSFLAAAGANLRPAARPEPVAHAAEVTPDPIAATAGSTVFARGMLSDIPSHAPRAARSTPVALDAHAASSVSPPPGLEADLEGLARLFGTDGRFTAQQRAALARLTPEQRAALAKLSRWAPSRKNAIIALVVLFVVFQIVPAIFSLLMNR